jgi:hypothetical protein
METLPTGMWEELQMLQLYPQACGKRCGNSSHSVANSTHSLWEEMSTTLPTLWEELQMLQLYPHSLWVEMWRHVGKYVATLSIGLWEEMWKLFP